MDEYFIYNGVDSRDMGVRLQGPLSFSAPEPNVSYETIPGRSGVLTSWDGSYTNITGQARCFALRRDVGNAMGQITSWLMDAPGYHRLELPGDPDHFRLAVVSAGPAIDIRGGVLAPFEVTFNCKPQRYLKSGETAIELTESGSYLYNPYMESKPLIEIRGSGVTGGTLKINDTEITIKNAGPSGVMILDCENQDVYYDKKNLNSYVSAPEFPVLQHGTNAISWTGKITRLRIYPRWWVL